MRDTQQTTLQLQDRITIPTVRRITIAATIPIPPRTIVKDHRATVAVVDIAADTPAVAAAAVVVAAATAVAVLRVVTAAAGAAATVGAAAVEMLVQPAARPRPRRLPPDM